MATKKRATRDKTKAQARRDKPKRRKAPASRRKAPVPPPRSPDAPRRGRPPRGYVRLEVRVPPHVRTMVITEAAERSTEDVLVSAGDVVADAIINRNAPRVRFVRYEPGPTPESKPLG